MNKNKPNLRSLAAGDVLFREGEVGDFAYQVSSGEIEICKFFHRGDVLKNRHFIGVKMVMVAHGQFF